MKSCLIELHKKYLTMPMAAILLLAASIGSLATAFTAEHFFGVDPCVLCLFQRVPYGLAVILTALALAVRANDKRARCLLGITALVFFINVGIAFFHSGVELHWWAGTDGCAVTPLNQATDAATLRAQLLAKVTAQCDEINFSFLGFSMANWNVLASFGLGLFALLASFGPCINWAKPGCCGTEGKNDKPGCCG